MDGMKKLLLALLPAWLGLFSCFADVPPPPPKGEKVQIRILKDSVGQGGPVLQIPANLFTKHAAFLDMPRPVTSGPVGLVIAGILLAVAIFFLGRLLFRRRDSGAKKPVTHAALALLLLASAGALVERSGAATANLNDIVADGQEIQGTVTVQIVADSHDVVLHLVPPRRPLWRPQPRPEQK